MLAQNLHRLSPLAFSLVLVLTGCGSGEEDRESTTASYYDLTASLEEAADEARLVLGPQGELKRAVWDQKSQGSTWSTIVLEEFHSRRSAFEAAKDIDDFCPHYAGATDFQKDTCWLRIVSSMARYESHFRPSATYLEKTGRTSVGLMMMNPDHCPKANTIAKLKNSSLNLKCALSRMSLLISRDRVVSGPKNTGAAAYWSVMRAPYRFETLNLGRRPHIQVFTRTYMAYRR